MAGKVHWDIHAYGCRYRRTVVGSNAHTAIASTSTKTTLTNLSVPRKFVFAIVCGPLTYAVLAFVLALVPGRSADIKNGPNSVLLHLVRSPIHYDFLLPLDVFTVEQLGWLEETGIELAHPNAEWLVVGWGAEQFYTTVGDYSDVGLPAIWAGLTGDDSVMRVSLSGRIEPEWPTRPIQMSKGQYKALLAFIEDSFAHGRETTALQVPGFSAFDRFFPAKGAFNVFNTCNVWIGRALRSAGVRFGSWTPAPYSVSLSVWILAD